MKLLRVALLLISAFVSHAMAGELPLLPLNVPFINAEDISWLFAAQTGKQPDFASLIQHPDYVVNTISKNSISFSRSNGFCDINSLRTAACDFHRNEDPIYLNQFTRIAQERILALKGLNEIFLPGGQLKANAYDSIRKTQKVEFSGRIIGLTFSRLCWYSDSRETSHSACLAIDNVKALNSAEMPIPDRESLTQVESMLNAGDLSLVVKFRIRQPFALDKLYMPGDHYALDPNGGEKTYTAWLVATDMYLVGRDREIYYDIEIPATDSQLDRVESEMATIEKTRENNRQADWRQTKVKHLRADLPPTKIISTPPKSLAPLSADEEARSASIFEQLNTHQGAK